MSLSRMLPSVRRLSPVSFALCTLHRRFFARVCGRTANRATKFAASVGCSGISPWKLGMFSHFCHVHSLFLIVSLALDAGSWTDSTQFLVIDFRKCLFACLCRQRCVFGHNTSQSLYAFPERLWSGSGCVLMISKDAKATLHYSVHLRIHADNDDFSALLRV